MAAERNLLLLSLSPSPSSSDRVGFQQAGIKDEEYVINWDRTYQVQHEPGDDSDDSVMTR